MLSLGDLSLYPISNKFCTDEFTPSSSYADVVQEISAVEEPASDVSFDPVQKLAVLKSETVSMICSISSPDEYDELQVVFWYKEGEETPLFIYDMRKSHYRVSNVKQVLEGSRYQRFYFSDSKQFVALTVNNVSLVDEGLYRCRIDFRKSPTRISSFILNVTVPPEKLSVRNRGLEIMSHVGPFNEGDNVTLYCETIGGIPPPKLIWLRNGKEMIDDERNSTLVDLVNDVYIVRHLITFRFLKRQDAATNATCVAKSMELNSSLLSTSVNILLNLAPLSVSIQLPAEEKTLSSNVYHEAFCSVIGSHPTVNVTWFLGERHLMASNESKSKDGNLTVSHLRLRPRIDDNDLFLRCLAHNPALPNNTLESSVQISVSYTPITFVSFGLNLKPNEIKEGDDVYFECKVKAYPKATKLSWRHNGKLLHHNPGMGIILSTQSLVLQHVDKVSAGNYTCHAFNSEGEGSSQPLHLIVKHRPYCLSNETLVYGLAIGEYVNVPCRVRGFPQGYLSYKWNFNNSHEVSVIPENRSKVNESGSFIVYRILDEFDYGVLTCSASNEIGVSKEQCRFQIVPVGPPGAPKLCNTTKENSESLQIECVEGFDGGLTQIFVLEAYSESGNLVANMTGSQPKFQLKLLEPTYIYELNLWAANSKGRSEVVRILAAPRRTKDSGGSVVYAEPVMQVSPIVGTIIGSVFALVLLTLGIAISIHVRRQQGNELVDRGSGDATKVELKVSNCQNSPDLIIGSNYRNMEGREEQYPHGISLVTNEMERWDSSQLNNQPNASKYLKPKHGCDTGKLQKIYTADPHLLKEVSFGVLIGESEFRSSQTQKSFSNRNLGKENSHQNESSV
ncbi:protein turtle-like isoform X2 [Artemia franciscana]|uniref:protein turtle-like isoform X2 n=1 Tax=Artemia franciscana TaxID=6661 RepID=UPI0032DA60C8